MFRIDQLKITGYKNYASGDFYFKDRIIGICGYNGVGKTNLLDALHYLCLTRSYFSRTDALNIHFDHDGFRLEATVTTGEDQPTTVVCIYRPGGKKEILLDGIPYEKFSQHIGKFPCVFIAPDDIALLTGGGEERRKYLDTLISQVDDTYLNKLISYNKLLAERNALFKYEVQYNKREEDLLQTIDDQMAPIGNYLYQVRSDFSTRIFPLIKSFHQLISGGSEIVTMRYESQLHNTAFETLLQSSREKDRTLLRTNTGIHRDDIVFEMSGNLFKNIASQGQRKSLLFACRLAAFEILKTEKGFAPLLLLDDIFEKLDDKRMDQLLEIICRQNEGQVFITDTSAARLRVAVEKFTGPLQIIELN